MSEANEAKETVAESIIKQLVGDKDDNATYRQHIRALIESDFFYCVVVSDHSSISVTANGKSSHDWQNFMLIALEKILKHAPAPDNEEPYEGKKNGAAGDPSYG